MGKTKVHQILCETKRKIALPFLALTCLILYCGKVMAAEIPGGFTADSIALEGVEDRNFANAIFSSISKEIESGNYEPDSSWSTREILENYSPANLKDGRAEINASGCGIRSVEGIKLLQNASTIDLRQNDIHDLSPLQSDGSAEDQLYFNGTRIELGGKNFYNVIPAELIGSREGSYVFDSVMTFEPVELNYLCSDEEKKVKLDFDLNLHGDEGGVFNKIYSEMASEVPVGINLTEYADNVSRHTGTEITIIGNADSLLLISANANENIDPYLSPTMQYYSEGRIEATLNLEWQYPFRTRFYRTLKETFRSEIYGGVKLLKTDEEGTPLGGAVYQLYRLEGSMRTRYPDAAAVYTTGEDGRLTITDLPAGSYELVESEAPEGFEADSAPLAFTVGSSAEALISEEVTGGVSEIEVTSGNAEFIPLWDAVTEDDGNGHTVRTHRMIMKGGSTETVSASSRDADCFLANQGREITRLAGEPLDPERLALIPGQTTVRVYAGDVLTGTFSDPAEAREALNEMIRTGAFGSGTGNITVTAEAAYREDESLYREITHKNRKKEKPHSDSEEKSPVPPAVTAEKDTEIRILKTWEGTEHPERAVFQLFLKRKDGSQCQIGKSKEANTDNAFQVSWSYKEIKTAAAETASASNAVPDTATASDASASPSDASKASPSDASKTVLYDEDGMLLDGFVLDDLEEEVYAEETEIPTGWEPEYFEPEYSSQGVVLLKVRNRKVQSPEEDHPENRITERTYSSGGGSSGAEYGTPAAAGAVPPVEPLKEQEENHPVQEVLGAARNRRVIQLPGLPYGVIAARGLPQMGQQEDFPPERSFIFLIIAAALGTGTVMLKKKRRKEEAERE